VQVVALADKDLGRALRLGRRYGIARCTDDYRAWLTDVDGVIVAVPNHLHASVAREALERGVAVLVEKPLASTLAEAEALAALSHTSGVPLQVGHMYRFSKTARLVKRAIDEGWLGPLRGFSIRYGVVSSWPATSGFYWRKEQAGGGILMDMGPHALDLLRWWLGDVRVVEYYDDAAGGVEADCRLSLIVPAPAGDLQGEVVLSRLRRLGGIAKIAGERFVIECDLRTLGARIRPAAWGAGDPSFAADFAPASDSFRGMFAEQLRAFAAAIRGGATSPVPADAVLPTMAVIERCYRERRPLEHGWQAYPARAATP
jgi:predicted dehydrogenase